MEDLTLLCAFTVSIGICSHLYFIRGEHDQHAHQWILRILTGTVALTLVVLFKTKFYFLQSIIITTLLTASYFLGLYGSILLYRLAFHPLRRFPGPFWAKVSNLYHGYMVRRSDNYLWIRTLHERYGPIVRTGMCFMISFKMNKINRRIGPNNLSINDPSAIPVVLSNEAKCMKSSWYDRSLPLVNLHTSRNKKVHDARRRVFSKAFTPSALRDYEERVAMHCEEFIRQMDRLSGRPFDASAWLKYFGMGPRFSYVNSFC